MDGMLGIFQSVLNLKRDDITTFTKALNEHQCFQQASSGRSEFISNLTGLLSNVGTRYEGLLLLDEVLRQCSVDILEQKGALWAGLCIKTLSQNNLSVCVPMACQSLSILIEKSTEIPELSKAFTNNLLGNFFDSLKNAPSNGQLDILKCIETGLRTYPNACGPHRVIIERFIGTFVNCEDSDIVSQAGKCLHVLQQIRGGNTVGISYQEAWQKLQLQFLGSLHETMDHFFSDCPEIHDRIENTETFNIPALDLSDDPIIRATQLFNRFKNLKSYLLAALTEPFSVPKQIMPRRILDLIARGLSINCVILGKTTTSNNLAIGALLPEIHIELYNILDALILILKSNMAPYVHMILGFVLDTLKWTSSGKSTGFTKSYSRLRIAAYNSLSLWNKTMKYGSCCELISEYVVEQIKYDIMPFQNEVTLKVLSGGKKHMSKKARRLLHKAQNEQSNMSQVHSKAFNPHNTKIIHSDEGNQDVCAAALNCLKYFMTASTCFLKPVVVKDILDNIFSLAVHVMNCDASLKTQLYSSYVCRLNLYEVIWAIISDSHHLCAPPIQLVIDIFSVAQAKDHNELVRSTCNQYLKLIEKIVHPQKATLYFPIDKSNVKRALRNQKRSAQTLQENVNSSDSEEETEVAANERANSMKQEKGLDEKMEIENVDIDDELTEIDLTKDQEEHSSYVDNVDITNELEDDEVMEKISLESSTEKSPDVMEIYEEVLAPPKVINECEGDLLLAVHTDIDISKAEKEFEKVTEEECDEPVSKKRKTSVDQEGEVDIDPSKDEGSSGEKDQTGKENEKDEEEIEDDLVEKCLEDFVDELNENVNTSK